MFWEIEVLRFATPDGAGPYWRRADRVQAASMIEAAEKFVQVHHVGQSPRWWMDHIFDCGMNRYRITQG